MTSRSQITQFIALGIILVIAVGLFLVIKTQFFPTQIVSTEFVPVAEYVKNCAEQKTQEAVKLMGVQGGYAYIPDEITYDPLSYIQNVPGMITPYWYYKGESRMPSLQNMEADISRYVKENVKQCTGDFEGFQDEFEITQTGDINATAHISDENIEVELTYPLSMKLKGKEQVEEINKIATTTDVRLGRVYALAKNIMDAENTQTFLENNTMDMISVADLPLEGLEMACGKQWSIQTQIRPELQNIIKYNFHYLNFKNTKYDDSGIEYYNSFYTPEVSTRSDRDIRVKTIYNSRFGMDLDVYPSHGDITSGIDLNVPDVIPCLNIYHHFYTIEYPVLFQLTDEKDPANTYNFFFATPVIIDKNNARRVKPIEIVDDSLATITSDQYCDNKNYDMTIFAVDKNTGQELEGANIEYECVSFNCKLGTTAQPTYDGIPMAGALPKFEGKFPPCTNGFLIAKKDGYVDGVLQQTADESTHGTSTTVEMVPLKKMDYSFVIKEGKSTRLRRDNEIVFMTIEDAQNDYKASVYYPTDMEQFSTLNLPVRDATYDIDVKLLVNETVVGGLEFDGLNVTQDEIEKGNFIGFTILSSEPQPTSMEEYINLYKNTILPESANYTPKIE